MVKVAPSVLSADFGKLNEDIEMLNASEADYIHIDVMDGVFVPNISFGFPVIKSIAKVAQKPLDVHLMIVDPQRYVSQVRDCGAEIMNVHVEACNHLHRVVQQIKGAGMKAAVTLNPATPVVMLEDIITDLDMVLLMSVNPGFGGQSFIPGTIRKLRQTTQLIKQSGSKALIEIDGGVNLATGAELAANGADILVAGSFVFSSENPVATIAELKKV
ncbi:MAG: ribulose-phosphate 3-epimerase [Paramuribaculum sp.]|nr:ribulose-phosphate 3-epimerase [Paramuribaculum sp.]MDE6459838.1 ribulose-phosphate 3-epimerase [Paramuribaculum sp.]